MARFVVDSIAHLPQVQTTEDRRLSKAITLAQKGYTWKRIQDRMGEKFYGIPSSRGDTLYLVNEQSCTCLDFTYRHEECYHIIAAGLWADRCRMRRKAVKNG